MKKSKKKRERLDDAVLRAFEVFLGTTRFNSSADGIAMFKLAEKIERAIRKTKR